MTMHELPEDFRLLDGITVYDTCVAHIFELAYRDAYKLTKPVETPIGTLYSLTAHTVDIGYILFSPYLDDTGAELVLPHAQVIKLTTTYTGDIYYDSRILICAREDDLLVAQVPNYAMDGDSARKKYKD